MVKTEGAAAGAEESDMPKVKKVKLNLVGQNGNAFSLLAAFRKQACKEGWTPEELADVQIEATSGDYDHLLQTLIKHTK